MSLPLEHPTSPTEGLSTPFLALVGAIAGGLPQLLVPTSTLPFLIGNAIMGALVVATLDAILLRKTLEGQQLRKARILLLIAVSVALTMVTYITPAAAFQTVFDTAPPQGIEKIAAQAYTRDHPGNVGYRFSFYATPIAIHTLEERMDKLSLEEYNPEKEAWNTFLSRHLPPNSPLAEPAKALTTPQGLIWTGTTDPTHSNATDAKTILLRSNDNNLTLVEHIPG